MAKSEKQRLRRKLARRTIGRIPLRQAQQETALNERRWEACDVVLPGGTICGNRDCLHMSLPLDYERHAYQ